MGVKVFSIIYLFILLLSYNSQTAVAIADPADSRSLIAALNYNFAKYADWPEEHMSDSVQLCFFTDSFKSSFSALEDKAIFDKSVTIRHLDGVEETRDCHLVYIDRSERELLQRLFVFVRDKPILTVSDITGFAEDGGMIEIFRVNNKFRFKVNLQQIHKSRLKMSSQVLKLAVEVK